MQLHQIKVTSNREVAGKRHFYMLEWRQGQSPVVTASEYGDRIGTDPQIVAELTATAERLSSIVASTCKTPADQIQIEFNENSRRVRGGFWAGSQQGCSFQQFKDSTIEKISAAL